MPREPSIAESAKQRSLRIPLDYYARGDAILRTKFVLSAIAAIGGGAYLAWILLAGPTAHKHVSPGPVAPVHSTWNQQCDVCHQSSQPLRSDAVSLTSLFTGQAESRERLDQACIKCHDEPPHHASARPGDVPSCAACHREHQGSAATIARSSDAMCLNCHRELERHREGQSGLADAIANVTSFAPAPHEGIAPHPDFRSLRSDPGNIKFNHWLHLQPGIAPSDAKHKLKLANLNDRYRPQYAAFAKTGDLIQLDCSACHRPGASSGASMLPIAFEQHCRACHPLQLRGNGESLADVPHGLPGERLAVFLDGLLFDAERNRHPTGFTSEDESGKLPLIPGKTLGHNLAQKITQDVLGRRANASRLIAMKCDQCHYPAAAVDASEHSVNVLPADVPNPWLQHARFNHNSHRHVNCRHCHQAAYAFERRDQPQFITPTSGKQHADDDEQVMIAGLETCVNCHAPKSGQQGGARHDCAQCHDYHGRDKLSFPGSSLGTHYREAPASPAPPIQPALRLASFQQSLTTTWTGSSSCSSAGCHGDAQSSSPKWQTAVTAWAANDPHAQAYDVLWTHRARAMTRLLHALQPNASAISDADHLATLNDRCVGCHATQTREDNDRALGVSCESCHGAAGGWLHEHQQSGFSRASMGFINTKDLAQRAHACMPCHVGTSDAEGRPQVDHDLVAAGHPRLAFEFHAYFQSLPAHWDRQTDEGRHSGDFHFRSWQAGQTQQARQRRLLPQNPPLDFAQLDCFACHHKLAADAWRRPSPAGPLTATDWPHIPLPDWAERVAPQRRIAFVRDLLLDARDQHTGWDASQQAYLAARATLGDLTLPSHPSAPGDLASVAAALDKLARYLASDCFPSIHRQPTQYDSPSEFDSRQYSRHVTPLIDAFQRLEATLSAR